VGFTISLLRAPSPSQPSRWVSKPMPPPPSAPATLFRVEEEALHTGKPGLSERLSSSKVETKEKPAGPGVAKPLKKPSTTAQPPPFAFTLHVESFRDPLAAHKRAEFYKALGLESFIRKVEIPGKGTFHRVFVGRLQRREEAEGLQRRLEQQYGLHGGRVVSAQDLGR